MLKDHLSSMNIEKFAAFLDGNLSQEDMLEIQQCISTNSTWNELYDITQDIDESIADNDKCGLEIPQKILDMDFSIPQIHDDIHSSAATLTPDCFWENFHSTEGMCACVDPSSSSLDIDKGQEENTSFLHDNMCSIDDTLVDDSDFTVE